MTCSARDCVIGTGCFGTPCVQSHARGDTSVVIPGHRHCKPCHGRCALRSTCGSWWEVAPPANSSMEALAEISLSCLSVPRLRGILSYPAAISILPVRKRLVQQRRRVLPRNASVRQWDQAHTPPGYDSVWDCHGGVTFYTLEV